MHNQSYQFIALSRRHRQTCFGHCCAHHQEPPPTAFAASGYRMIAGLDVFQAVVGLLVIYIRLIVHLVGCFIEYLKMHGTTNPKYKDCRSNLSISVINY
jgi:hypothetical protein